LTVHETMHFVFGGEKYYIIGYAM